MAEEKSFLPVVKSAMGDILGSEDLLVEAARDMIKDELKRYIRQKLDGDPALRNEIKEAISLYFEAKSREIYAAAKLAKCGAKLGLMLLPKGVKDEVSKELLHIFEKELSEMMERGL